MRFTAKLLKQSSPSKDICTKMLHELQARFPNIPFVQDQGKESEDYLWVEDPSRVDSVSTCLVSLHDGEAFLRSPEVKRGMSDDLLASFPEADEVWNLLDELLLLNGFVPDMADTHEMYVSRGITVYIKRKGKQEVS